MKLFSLPFLKKKNPYSYFLVLVLRNEKANAVIFEELEGKIRVIGQHVEYFENSIGQASIDEMLEVLDKAIATAEESLPENIETQRTIFGVKEGWVENDKIKKEHLLKLKKVCDELGLTPIGFLIISQAISHLLQKEEGAPVSAILVEFGNKSVTVSLIRGGRIIETKISEIHQSIPYTVDTLLKHFQTSEILPSRIILFDGESDLSQEFLSHTWSKSLPFLHLPQIATLPVNFDSRAVLFGAATQMGFEVLQEPIKKEQHATQDLEKPIQELEIKQENYLSLEDFGFIAEKGIPKNPLSQKQEKKETLSQTELLPSKRSRIKAPSFALTIKDNLSKVLPQFKKIPIKKALSLFSAIPSGKKNIFVSIAVISAIALFTIFYLFGTSQTVTLKIKPKTVVQNKTVVFSTSTSTDPSKGIVAAETVSVSEEGTNSTAATGKKEIGDYAKGKVTIFNSLSQGKTFSQGTKIKSPNGLEFLLAESLTIKGVASHSADEVVSPSTSVVSIAAARIGKESNLPSGTKFSVSTFDTADIVAKNDSPFNGGTKKEVTVVSKKDVDKLVEELPKLLQSNAIKNIAKKISKDKNLLPIFINKTLEKKKLDKEVGMEANKTTLAGTVSYVGLTYKNEDLNSLALSFIKESIPSNMTINNNNTKIEIKDITQKDKDLTANLNIKALLMPKIDKKSLATSVLGVSETKAKDKLSKIPQVSDIHISFTPNIPFLPKILTRSSKNIKIEITVNE